MLLAVLRPFSVYLARCLIAPLLLRTRRINLSGSWNLRVFRLADLAVAWVDARG
jgi:hypothetical protein